MKLTTHLHPLPRSRMMELYLHSPLCLHGVVLNYVINYTLAQFTYFEEIKAGLCDFHPVCVSLPRNQLLNA
jgi:hypothetical protein